MALKNGLVMKAVIDGGNVVQTLGTAVLGRILAEDVLLPNSKEIPFRKRSFNNLCLILIRSMN